jgi:predicted Fe-Mo cluster-binding NifX family protein
MSVMAAVLLVSPAEGGEAGELKTAIASQARTADGAVAARAARAPYYLLFGPDGDLLEVLENPASRASRSAGAGAAEFLARQGETLVVAGHFGPRMINALDSRGIEHLEFSGKVTDALKEAKRRGQR